jgi:hypothetical protein
VIGVIVLLAALAVGVVIAAMAASLDDHTAWLDALADDDDREMTP